MVLDRLELMVMTESRPAASSPVMKPELLALGLRVRALREAAGFTQGALADVVGFSRPTINKIEIGREDLGASRLIRLAAALGVDVGSLFRAD